MVNIGGNMNNANNVVNAIHGDNAGYPPQVSVQSPTVETSSTVPVAVAPEILPPESHESQESHILTYISSSAQIYGMGFCWRRENKFRFSVGSFSESGENKFEIIDLNCRENGFVRRASIPHIYPPTKIMWIPDVECSYPDLIGTSSDCLRLWLLSENSSTGEMNLTNKCILANNKQTKFNAPLTSFDWNLIDKNCIGTCSIDTTCTIWDIEHQTVKTQLIAHDKEVYDIAFSHGLHTFASAGADGSLRHFDLRNLEHSTIIYESQENTPFLRIAWNCQDPNYLATMMLDQTRAIILDIRFPMMAVAELVGHNDSINSLAWAPNSSYHICTGGDDSQTLIWDLSMISQNAATEEGSNTVDPQLSYSSDGEVNTLQWPVTNPSWVAIAFKNKVQMLRV